MNGRLLSLFAASVFTACGQNGGAEISEDYVELNELRVQENESLYSYQVADKKTGRYQIPIDRAISWVASDPTMLEPVVELPDLAELGPVARGQYHFELSYACSGCHAVDGSVKQGPALNKRWGTNSPLEGGDSVVFDDAYFTESVLASRAKLVRGFQPIMPAFEGRIPSRDLEDIRLYLKSL